jgi:hypothetical protein
MVLLILVWGATLGILSRTSERNLTSIYLVKCALLSVGENYTISACALFMDNTIQKPLLLLETGGFQIMLYRNPVSVGLTQPRRPVVLQRQLG